MAKYQANPVVVDAFVITGIGSKHNDGAIDLNIRKSVDEDGNDVHEAVHATSAMTARCEPKIGDYWVIQEDGYIYLNPKNVFERKYSWVDETPVGATKPEAVETSEPVIEPEIVPQEENA